MSTHNICFHQEIKNYLPDTHSLSRHVKLLIFFFFLHENICCGNSLEMANHATSNEYPQHTFLWRNKKNNCPATLHMKR